MTPDLGWWGTLAGLLAVQAAALTALGAAAELRVRAPQARRALWQAVLLAVALVWIAEITGLPGRLKLLAFLDKTPPPVTANLRPAPSAKAAPVSEEANENHRFHGLSQIGRSEARSTSPMLESSTASDLSTAGWIEEEFPIEPSVVTPSPAPPPAIPVKWPGWIWLGGATLLLLRSALAQACLALRRRRTTGAGVETEAMVASLRRPLGLGRISLQVWPGLRGPIAFGLFRPTVALPADFASRFTPVQREAMLAHELAHLAARDPFWLGLADAILALAWWHPAVWWARRRLRVAGEAAADEASALVPSGPTALAESLVLFGRELASPGLTRALGVGGSGFRSDLARRVGALLNHSGRWRQISTVRQWWPRAAAIGIAAMLAVAPVRAGFSGSLLTALTLPAPVEAVKTSERSPQQESATNRVDKASKKIAPILELAQATPLTPSTEPAITTNQTDVTTNLVHSGAGRRAIRAKLEHIRLNEVFFDNLPLTEVLKKLSDEAIKRDPDHVGINFMINSARNSPPASTDPAAPPSAPQDLGIVSIRIKPALHDIKLGNVLDAICQVADQPILYDIEDYGVVFIPRSEVPLITRKFKVNPNTFVQGLQGISLINARPVEGTNCGPVISTATNFTAVPPSGLSLHEMVRDYFLASGVNLDPPKGVFFNDRAGAILVTGTEEDLGLVQAAIKRLEALAHASTEPLPPPSTNLITRKFKLSDSTNFVQGVRLFSATKWASPSQPSGSIFGISFSNPTNDSAAFYQVLGPYFRWAGLNIDPPKFMILNEGNDSVLVRASEQDLDLVRDAILHIFKLSTSPWPSPDSRRPGPGAAMRTNLTTRLFTVSHTNFVEGLRRLKAGEPFDENDVGDGVFRTRQGSVGFVKQKDMSTPKHLHEVVRDYLTAFGLNLDPPKNFFFNDRAGWLMVTANKEDIETIRTAIDFLHVPDSAPPGSEPQTATNLTTQKFKVNPDTIVPFLKRFSAAIPASRPDTSSAGNQKEPSRGPGWAFAGPTNNVASLHQMLRDYIASLGVNLDVVNLDHPKSVFFNDRAGWIMVTATTADLKTIRSALESLKALEPTDPPAAGRTPEPHAKSTLPAVTLQVRFTELPEQSPGDLGLDWLFGRSPTNNPAPRTGPAAELLEATNLVHTENYRVDALRTEGESATLNAAQFQVLLETLEQREGIDILSTPTVKTFSGRTAGVSMQDILSIVSSVEATNASPSNKTQAGMNYLTEKVGVGTTAEVMPVAEGGSWRLTALARYTEFLGYDQPQKGDELVVNDGGKPVYGQKPLPHFRTREARASALLAPGQTLVLRGPSSGVTNKVKGSLFHKDKTEVVRERLYVVVTVLPEAPAAGRGDGVTTPKVVPGTGPTVVITGAERQRTEPDLVIAIAKEAPYLSVGMKSMTIEEVRELLQAEIARNPDLQVQIRPDRDAPVGEVLKIIESARVAKVKITPSLQVVPEKK